MPSSKLLLHPNASATDHAEDNETVIAANKPASNNPIPNSIAGTNPNFSCNAPMSSEGPAFSISGIHQNKAAPINIINTAMTTCKTQPITVSIFPFRKSSFLDPLLIYALF